jgi:hypothetical protein
LDQSRCARPSHHRRTASDASPHLYVTSTYYIYIYIGGGSFTQYSSRAQTHSASADTRARPYSHTHTDHACVRVCLSRALFPAFNQYTHLSATFVSSLHQCIAGVPFFLVRLPSRGQERASPTRTRSIEPNLRRDRRGRTIIITIIIPLIIS